MSTYIAPHLLRLQTCWLSGSLRGGVAWNVGGGRVKSPQRSSTRVDPAGEFPLDLPTYLFHLFAVISRHREARIDELLRPLDLNLSRHRALSVIQRLQPCAMSQLADFTAVDRTTLTRTVDQLVAAGLVERTTPASDRRQVLLSLTDKGRTTCRRSLQVIYGLNLRLVAGVAEADQRTVARVFETFVANLVPEPKLRGRLLLRERND
jgi:DNA-binding MarR family transcriptional regulator